MEKFRVDKFFFFFFFFKSMVKVNVSKINVCQIVKVSAHVDRWFNFIFWALGN